MSLLICFIMFAEIRNGINAFDNQKASSNGEKREKNHNQLLAYLYHYFIGHGLGLQSNRFLYLIYLFI